MNNRIIFAVNKYNMIIFSQQVYSSQFLFILALFT